MSCKKEGCCNQNRPRAEMTALPDWVVSQLLTVAQTGFKNLLPWPNESVRVLADRIASLVAEVELLRKLLNRDTKPVPVAADMVTFTFGPNNQYSLHITVADTQTRKQLAEALVRTAAELAPRERITALPDQLDLPFAE